MALSKQKSKRKQALKILHKPMANSNEFYVSEKTASYGHKKPFVVYYEDKAHSVKLLKGDSIEILNQARENSVEMIFADPPYFLSNGGISCHAGKMVSVKTSSTATAFRGNAFLIE